MIFDFFKKFKSRQVQEEYLDLLLKIMSSPLWNGSDEQLQDSLPADLNQATIEYAKQLFQKSQ